MELRRHKDIIAFKDKSADLIAFHARNLEVAEISAEVWEDMKPVSVSSSLSDFTSEENEITKSLNFWNNENNAQVKSGRIEFGIRSLTINITQICNLHCTYCAAGGDGTYGEAQKKISVEKTIPQLKFFLDKVPNGGTFHITFLGGEPLLYPEAIELIADYVTLATAGRAIKADFSITTNGTLIDEKALRILTKTKCKVTVSLDGPKEINDRSRPKKNGQGSTEDVIAGIKKLVEHKDQLGGLFIHSVFSENNSDLRAAYQFFSEFEVDGLDFVYSVNSSAEILSQKYIAEMQSIADLAFKKGGESELRKIGLFDRYFDTLDNQQQVENYCGAGKSYLMIDARNQIYTCPWEVGQRESQVGSGSILSTEKLKDLAIPLIERNNCQTCWARFVCGGGCMFAHKSATKSKNLKDINFCIRTRSLLLTAISYYKQCRLICEEVSNG